MYCRNFDYNEVGPKVEKLLLDAIPAPNTIKVTRGNDWIDGAPFSATHCAQITRIIALPYIARAIVKVATQALYRAEVSPPQVGESLLGYLQGYLSPLIDREVPMIPIVSMASQEEVSPWSRGTYIFENENDVMVWRVSPKYPKIANTDAYVRTWGQWETRPAMQQQYSQVLMLSGHLNRLSYNCCYMFSSDITAGQCGHMKGHKMRMYQLASMVRDLVAIGDGYTGIIGIWASRPQRFLVESKAIAAEKYSLHPDSCYNMRYNSDDMRSLNHVMVHPIIKNSPTGTSGQTYGTFPIWYPEPKAYTALLKSKEFWDNLMAIFAKDTTPTSLLDKTTQVLPSLTVRE
jgi:hypothetical protein